MSSRFFVPPEQIQGDRFVLLGSEARHAALVLRKKNGDVIQLFDGKDCSYEGRLTLVGPDRVEGILLSAIQEERSERVHLTLAQALIKGPKWDWLVEKASEIGVTTLLPVITQRGLNRQPREGGHERWRRIALAAAKQCGRSRPMEIAPVQMFEQALRNMPSDVTALVPWEKETSLSIAEAPARSTEEVYLWIGPEGGWDDREIEAAKRKGAQTVRLGPTLLRSETAGLVAATLVLQKMGLYS